MLSDPGDRGLLVDLLRELHKAAKCPEFLRDFAPDFQGSSQ